MQTQNEFDASLEQRLNHLTTTVESLAQAVLLVNGRLDQIQPEKTAYESVSDTEKSNESNKQKSEPFGFLTNYDALEPVDKPLTDKEYTERYVSEDLPVILDHIEQGTGVSLIQESCSTLNTYQNARVPLIQEFCSTLNTDQNARAYILWYAASPAVRQMIRLFVLFQQIQLQPVSKEVIFGVVTLEEKTWLIETLKQTQKNLQVAELKTSI